MDDHVDRVLGCFCRPFSENFLNSFLALTIFWKCARYMCQMLSSRGTRTEFSKFRCLSFKLRNMSEQKFRLFTDMIDSRTKQASQFPWVPLMYIHKEVKVLHCWFFFLYFLITCGTYPIKDWKYYFNLNGFLPFTFAGFVDVPVSRTNFLLLIK